MEKRHNILILTSKTGGGHVSLAEALRDVLTDEYVIKIADVLPAAFHWHYSFVARHALWLWATEFRLTDSPEQALSSHRLLIPLIANRFKALLDAFQPDAIITTHPLLSHAIMCVLAKHVPSKQIPLVMMFSDARRVHATWLTENRAAAVLAPTQETLGQALAAGFDPSRLHFVGWPLRNQFYDKQLPTREQVFESINRGREWKLDPSHFTIFLQGGGDGAARVEQTVANLLAVSQKLQIILATGTNKALYTRFQEVKNLHPLPFTREIAQYMAATDIVLGKAGPNMLFESIALAKPFIATSYIPGQEEGNLELIQRHDLGWVALERAQQQRLISTLVAEFPHGSECLNAMSASVKTYWQQNINTSKPILSLIRSLIAGNNARSFVYGTAVPLDVSAS